MKKREHDRLLYIWEKLNLKKGSRRRFEISRSFGVCGTHSRISFCNVDSSKLGNRNFNWKILDDVAGGCFRNVNCLETIHTWLLLFNLSSEFYIIHTQSLERLEISISEMLVEILIKYGWIFLKEL